MSQSKACAFGVLFVVRLLLPTDDSVADGATAASGESTKKPPVVVVSYASALHVRTWPLAPWVFLLPEATHLCTGLLVLPTGTIPLEAKIATAGLGTATVGPSPSTGGTSCDALKSDRALFPVPGIPEGGLQLRLRIPTDLAPQPGTAAEGKVIVVVPAYDPLELPIKVTNVSSAGAIAAGWVLGIVVPALLTAALAYWGHQAATSFASRRKRDEDFEKFKDQNYDDLNRVFTHLYPSIFASKPPDLRTLADELRSKHIIDLVPRKVRRRLEAALAREDVPATVEALGLAFSHWKPDLDKKLREARDEQG
jgi:hypothetical protein